MLGLFIPGLYSFKNRIHHPFTTRLVADPGWAADWTSHLPHLAKPGCEVAWWLESLPFWSFFLLLWDLTYQIWDIPIYQIYSICIYIYGYHQRNISIDIEKQPLVDHFTPVPMDSHVIFLKLIWDQLGRGMIIGRSSQAWPIKQWQDMWQYLWTEKSKLI